MQSFQERFCEVHRCAAGDFSRKVFWRCLHRHAWPIVLFAGGHRSRYFAADRELIGRVGLAVKKNQVWQAISDFSSDPDNQGWLRKKAKFRVSAKRLMLLARNYLPGEDSASPVRR